MLLTACSTAESPRVAQLEQQLSTTQQENLSLEEQLATLKSREPQVQPASGSLDLPQAKAGECYARVFVPPNYQTKAEQMLKAEASERVEVIPASYQWAEEKVLVTEASERVEVIPASYKTVEERVLVSEASERVETVPAVYDTVTEQVLVKPAYTAWKKGRGPIEKIDQATGEIMCLVEVPAEYKTVAKRLLKTPATTRKITIPAEYKTITKRVVDQPATTRTIKIPAEYSTVKVQKLAQPAQEKRIAIPAEYQTVTKTEKISEGRLEWRPILCETNVTSDIVARIQRALSAKGHNPGPIDGVIGTETMSAVRSFQKANGLASGQLTIETLKALDVSLGV
jgi:hypothetical protein